MALTSTETKITFLGMASAVPGAGEDTASFLINGHFLIDCGWCNVLQMLACGYDPLALDTLLFTHCHHDHYLGLPALLFYRSMRGKPPLKIIGPPDDLPIVVERSLAFLQVERFDVMQQPLELVPLEPGASWSCERYEVQTIRALHPVTALCARITDKQTGAVIALSGDTSPHPDLANLARGADLLIHEASVAPYKPLDAKWGHSRATDAAQTALDAGAKALRLVHASAGHREASLKAAQKIFPAAAFAAQGETLTWPVTS